MNNLGLQYINRDSTYLLAVSGGIDSMVMFHLFLKSGLRFQVAHVNYQLRGEESDLDEELVSRTCQRHQIPFHRLTIDLKKEMDKKGISIQTSAREVRYSFFKEILEKEKLHRIATAHHADDHIETLLFHFFRGCGIEGLKGIPAKTEEVVRPLLHWPKQEIVAYAKTHAIEYRDDRSNSSTDYTRNKIRLEVIPQLENIFPTLKKNLVGNIARMNEVEAVFRESIASYRVRLMEQRGQDYYFPILKIQKLKVAATILYELLKPYQFNYEQSVQILNLMHSESGHWVENEKYKVIRNRQFLILTEKKEEKSDFILIQEMDKKVETSDFTLSIHSRKKEDLNLSKSLDTCTVPLAKLTFPLILRKWRQGDYLYPFGMNKKKKVARVLIDAKIPLHEKEHIWVLESDKKIVWILGLKSDHRFRMEAPVESLIMTFSSKHK